MILLLAWDKELLSVYLSHRWKPQCAQTKPWQTGTSQIGEEDVVSTTERFAQRFYGSLTTSLLADKFGSLEEAIDGDVEQVKSFCGLMSVAARKTNIWHEQRW